jgi:hypothetical protein
MEEATWKKGYRVWGMGYGVWGMGKEVPLGKATGFEL